MKGKIIKIVSNQYTVIDEKNERYVCAVKGNVRKQKLMAVGDNVQIDFVDQQPLIVDIDERKNHLIRPSIANVDQALIVMSTKDPDFSTVLVDQLSFLINHAGIVPVLCITKMDLVEKDDPLYEIIEDYRKSGIQVILTHKDEIESIIPYIQGKVTVLTGQSGAGKSSLINRLNPDFQLATQEISKALGRGKHTTRHCELHEIYGGWVADTPGFSSLDFSKMSVEELNASVSEFEPYLGKCRFRDCIHQNEPGCAVKEAVNEGKVSKIRYKNYVEVLKQIQNRRVKY
ncbi:MAG: ribosome small subunit-dependent GTPase A [Erysipelotrichaceae bacterium]|nr:ribosome small subunit-dependent GTPase A [Erysipelotrichaceae bacterium]